MKGNEVKKHVKRVEEIVDSLRLLDDQFMTLFFNQNFKATELMLNVILERKDIVVKRIEVQKVETSAALRGRNAVLDIFAEDSEGKHYDIEVQRADRGATWKRARFLSGVLDSRMLERGEDFSRMRDSYVIFITENDVMGEGLPMYHIERHIEELGNRKFEDGNHLIYVNGAYKNDIDDIGRLMHDFRCTSSVDMLYDVLREGMEHFKDTEGGRDKMCAAVETYGREQRLEGKSEGKTEGRLEGKTEGRLEEKIETARNLRKMGMDVSFIAKALKVTPDEVSKWLVDNQTQ